MQNRYGKIVGSKAKSVSGSSKTEYKKSPEIPEILFAIKNSGLRQ